MFFHRELLSYLTQEQLTILEQALCSAEGLGTLQRKAYSTTEQTPDPNSVTMSQLHNELEKPLEGKPCNSRSNGRVCEFVAEPLGSVQSQGLEADVSHSVVDISVQVVIMRALLRNYAEPTTEQCKEIRWSEEPWSCWLCKCRGLDAASLCGHIRRGRPTADQPCKGNESDTEEGFQSLSGRRFF